MGTDLLLSQPLDVKCNICNMGFMALPSELGGVLLVSP